MHHARLLCVHYHLLTPGSIEGVCERRTNFCTVFYWRRALFCTGRSPYRRFLRHRDVSRSKNNIVTNDGSHPNYCQVPQNENEIFISNQREPQYQITYVKKLVYCWSCKKGNIMKSNKSWSEHIKWIRKRTNMRLRWNTKCNTSQRILFGRVMNSKTLMTIWKVHNRVPEVLGRPKLSVTQVM